MMLYLLLLLMSHKVKWSNCMADANCFISWENVHLFNYCALASVLAATGKPQLVLCFKNCTKEHMLVNADFNVDSVYRKLLILDQICCVIWKCNGRQFVDTLLAYTVNYWYQHLFSRYHRHTILWDVLSQSCDIYWLVVWCIFWLISRCSFCWIYNWVLCFYQTSKQHKVVV